jgi:hypothetical protein
VLEGASGVKLITYQIELSDYAGGFPVKIDYTTLTGSTLGTATAGVDFSTTSGSLIFDAAGVKPVSVLVYGDTLAEAHETFTFQAKFADQAQQANGVTVPSFTTTSQATILNDEISLNIADPASAQAEGNAAGTGTLKYIVTLNGASDAPVTVHYRTVNGTGVHGAVAGSDFVGTADSTLVFAPGETSKEITIALNGDTDAELSENFSVELFQAEAGAGVTPSFARSLATGTIKNDDVTATIVSLGSQTEGNAAMKDFGFVVTIDRALPGDVTFFYSAQDGDSATVDERATLTDGDYVQTTNRAITIPAGQTSSAPFYVSVRGDVTKEKNESFGVKLSESSDALFAAGGLATATILNDDPNVSIGDVTVTEGTGGAVTAIFTVSLAAAPGPNERVEVAFATAEGTALSSGANPDFNAQTGTLTFAAGQTQKTVVVEILGDARHETASEQFFVNLTSATLITTVGSVETPTPYNIAKAQGTATILDNDTPTLSIASAGPVLENGGTGAKFTVTLSAASDVPISFDYRTLDGTATAANSDYVARALTTLIFAPNETSKEITIGINGDATDELNETFQLQISNAKVVGGAGLTITKAVETATILNDDRAVTIGNATLTEGNSGSAAINFTVTLSAASTHAVTVNYATREATSGTFHATAGSDYTPKTGTITIAAGQTSGTISIPILGDTTDEEDQTFEVLLTSVTNALGTDLFATGTILDDDAAPTVQIAPTVSVTEGNTTDTNATFTVTLSKASEKAVTVNYATAAGTATSGTDFTAVPAGVLTIPAGSLFATFNVAVKGDGLDEPNETFTATLSSATNATLGTQKVSIATIVDNDVLPSLSIGDVSGAENGGPLTFTVTLSAAYGEAVTVNYSTVDSTALAGSDFTLTSGTLTFLPGGSLTQTIVVPITADTANETDERFLVRLTQPVNATLSDGEAAGLIQNDETSFSVQDVTVSEEGPNGGAQTATVTVTRTGTGVASVQFTTVDGTAKSGTGKDFTALSGTLNFGANETSKTIVIPIGSDTAYENSEQFTVVLSNEVNGVLADATGMVTITDTDAAPTLSIASVSANESAANLVFTVRLSAVNEREDVIVQFETLDGTAVSSGTFLDFTARSGELKFAQGETTKVVAVALNHDTSNEDNQAFQVLLKNASGAALAGNGPTLAATGTIVDDDALVGLKVSDLTLVENESGVLGKTFTVSMPTSVFSEKTVTVKWRTDDGAPGTTATAGADYTSIPSTLLTFAPGETSKTLFVPVIDDTLNEVNETFQVVLELPTNATITDARGTATITDNDTTVPVVSINDVAVTEGENPTMIFTVSLSAPSGRELTVKYATADGTAKATGPFADYLAQNGTLTFAPGETSKTIAIPILDDAYLEKATDQGETDFTLVDEKFTVVLSSPTNVTLGDSTGEGTILNGADTQIGLAVSDITYVEGNSGTGTAKFRIQLSAPTPDSFTFNAATRNGTAVAGSDYSALSQTFTVAGPTTETIDDPANPGQTIEKQVAGKDFAEVGVTIGGDTAFEATENFFLDISAIGGDVAVVGADANGQLHPRAVIYNDDSQILNGGRTAQWIDIDGDLVTLTVSKGTLSSNSVVLSEAGSVGGKHLDVLNLLSNISGFFGTSITITADKQAGFTGESDGIVNIGEIRAGGTAANVELTWLGLDLGTVTVEGDLARIRAGDNVSTTALRKLEVGSLGTLGTSTNGADVSSEILGPVGSVIIHGDVGGSLSVFGSSFGTIGRLKVEGNLHGGTIANSGLIKVTAKIGSAELGGIVGGSGNSSGVLFGNTETSGVIGNVTVHGSIVGGAGTNAGSIIANRIGNVTVDSMEGAAGQDSGSIISGSTLGNVKVLGEITGGGGSRSGALFAVSSLGKVTVGDALTGGSGNQSGKIQAGRIASVSIVGAVTGGSGKDSGNIEAGDMTSVENTTEDSIVFGGRIGDVSVGSLVGGAGIRSGAIISTGEAGKIRIADDLIGGSGVRSGAVFTVGKTISVSVGGEVAGGASADSGSIASFGSIGTVLVEGDLNGGAGAGSGTISSDARFGGALGKVTVLGSVIGADGAISGQIAAPKIGDVSVNAFIGGAGAQSGMLYSLGSIGKVTVTQGIAGGAGSESGGIFAAGSIKSIGVGGAVLGAEGTTSGSIRTTGDLAKLTIGQNSNGQSLLGGSGVQSGIVSVSGNLADAFLSGDIVGGSANSTGALAVGGKLAKVTIDGDIQGGSTLATGDPLSNSGVLQAGLLGTANLTGSLLAGTDAGAGLKNSGAIRTGRIENLTIGGDVVGSAATPAIISGAASIDSSNVGIKNLIIKGNVSFAEILAGYKGNVTSSYRGQLTSADAQISKVEIGGTVLGLNLIAGADAGAEGRFGDATDVLASGAAVRDSAKVISQIASVILKGNVLPNADTYGIVAQHIVAVKVGTIGASLPGLANGAGNDLATANPDLSDSIGVGTKFRAVELAV